MIFDEIYSIYYKTVTEIINKLARDNYIYESDIEEIATRNGILHTKDISDPLVYNEWNIATSTKEYSNTKKTKILPVVENELTFPLSTIQKRWLKSISLDPRFKLFNIEINGLDDIEPLFSTEDYFIFDKNANGDDYSDPEYQKKFQFCLEAIRKKKIVVFGRAKRNGVKNYIVCKPTALEYSEKDDKFRIRVSGSKYVNIINLSSVFSYEFLSAEPIGQSCQISNRRQQVTLLITDTRKTLERFMLHFAHFRTSVQKTEKPDQYKVIIEYDEEDISEMIIRILRFGPYVEVLAPSDFRKKIIAKLKTQYQWNIN